MKAICSLMMDCIFVGSYGGKAFVAAPASGFVIVCVDSDVTVSANVL